MTKAEKITIYAGALSGAMSASMAMIVAGEDPGEGWVIEAAIEAGDAMIEALIQKEKEAQDEGI